MISRSAGALVAVLALCNARAYAADLSPRPTPQAPVPLAPEWTFRLTPYAWLTSLNGSQTIRGRKADVSASFPDIVSTTFNHGGTIAALMLDGEARKGPYSIFGDVVLEKITLSPSGVRTRSVAPGIGTAVGASLNADYRMGIVEGGAAYEFARVGNVSLDVIAGVRYWNQRVNLSLDAGATLDLGGLALSRNRAVARSGTVDWVDGFAGARARLSLAPGQELFLMANGGAGGSQFTWEAIAAYSYDFATRKGVTYSGILGYKALYANYSQGSGRTRYEFDIVQHGPVLGLNIRF
jgi:hypothetical protein